MTPIFSIKISICINFLNENKWKLIKSACESATTHHQNCYIHTLGKQTVECTSDIPTVYHLLHSLPSAGSLLAALCASLALGHP